MLEQVAWTRKWPAVPRSCGHPQRRIALRFFFTAAHLRLRSPATAGGAALRFFWPLRVSAAGFRNSAAIERSDFASGRSGHPQRFALKLKSTQAALPAGAAPIASAGALHVFLPLAAPSGDG